MKKTILITIALPLFIFHFGNLPYPSPAVHFHSPEEFASFQQLVFDPFPPIAPPPLLQIDSNILFPTAKTCSGCHGHDLSGFALVSTSGEDVNIFDDWRSTMMANAARDPFWRAKVTHEMLVNPSHSLALQDKCTTCHAPAGHYQAKLKRHQAYYTLGEVYADSLGLDGVTCQICHAQAPGDNGSLHSGALNFDTNFIRVAYGQYEIPFVPPMHDFVGITPKYGEHIGEAGLCAGCHTLITGTVDLAGQATGGTFTEQATYHEWLNSRYDEQHDNITCQACHLPRLYDEVIISANYQFLAPQFPFGLHELAGANVTMLRLMKENRDRLEIPAEAEHFDSTIAATLRMLQQKTLDVSLQPLVLSGDTAIFDLTLLNKAGHKFPSGYPSRRAWVEFEVKNATGESLFHSGRMNPDFSLAHEDAQVEPHYQVIDRPEQVQIYEMVPGDVTGAFTNVLERGDKALKDNRLVPQGFRLNDPAYDTTQIIGTALNDPDFNHTAGFEGSGSDILHFHIPLNGYAGTISVSAKVWYQSLPPKWMAPMFAFSSPEIDTFRSMFAAADRTPVLVADIRLDSLLVTPVATKLAQDNPIRVYPTLSTDGWVYIDVPENGQLKGIKVWNTSGQLVSDQRSNEISLPREKGIYFIAIQTNKGKFVRRVIRN